MVSGWLAGQSETADRLNDNHARTIDFTAITANSATSASTTELVAITTPSITFRNGRAFKVTFKGLATNTVANDQIGVKVRKTNTTTTPILLDSFRVNLGAAGTYLFYFRSVFINTSGADISTLLVGTFMRVTGGTGNINITASVTSPAYLETEDIGDSDDFLNAATLT